MPKPAPTASTHRGSRPARRCRRSSPPRPRSPSTCSRAGRSSPSRRRPSSGSAGSASAARSPARHGAASSTPRRRSPTTAPSRGSRVCPTWTRCSATSRYRVARTFPPTEGVAVAVAYIQEFAIGDRSTRNYDFVADQIGEGPFDGLIAHTAGFDDDAGVFRIFDIWGTREQAERVIAENIQPLIEEGPAGFPNPPPPTPPPPGGLFQVAPARRGG